MGLPTACLLGNIGAKVVGSDTNARIVESVNRGISPLPEPGLGQYVKKLSKEGKLKANVILTRDAGHLLPRFFNIK
jgi:UDP-N-acetyl-D-mannosaminuronate dehydrogenase